MKLDKNEWILNMKQEDKLDFIIEAINSFNRTV